MTPPTRGHAPAKTCGQTAAWEAGSAETLVCDDARFHTAYVADEGFAIGYIEEESEWRQCRACGKAWVYIDEAVVGCRRCGSGDTEMVEEAELMAKNREF